MKPWTPLLLALALLTILLPACRRDNAPDSSRSPDSEDVGDAPAVGAPAVAEPVPAARPVGVPPPVNDSGMSFTDMDKNMDSGITRDELPNSEMLHGHFDEADTSGDGRLSFAEIERHRLDMTKPPQRVVTDGRSIVQMDRNGDGGVSIDELWDNEMLHRHFEEADGDSDGTLSAAEIDAHRAAMATGE